jgi:hypothetical protein
LIQLPEYLKIGDWCLQGLPFYCGNVVYSNKFDFSKQKDVKYVFHLGSHKATAVELVLNDSEPILMTHGNFQADVSDFLENGDNYICLRFLGSRRNGFGPLHMAEKPVFIGPASFREVTCQWQETTKLLPYGLLEKPVLLKHM